MKKNKWTRLAAVLLVLCLVTTCTVSGTFAKYVTTDSGMDEARVAKWGVTLEVDGELFNDGYKKATDNNPSNDTANLTVLSSTNTRNHAGTNGKDRVVAPGTRNDQGMTFSINGKPEVAVKVDVKLTGTSLTGDPRDIVLKAGTYRDWTKSGLNQDYPDSFELTADYYPVVFTLVQTEAADTLTFDIDTDGDGTNDAKKIAQGNLKAIKDALDAYSSTAIYAPNTDLKATFRLTWEWPYSDVTTGISNNDRADTLLGNLSQDQGFTFTGPDGATVTKAFKDVSKPEGSGWTGLSQMTSADVSTGDFYEEIDLGFTLTVTQID